MTAVIGTCTQVAFRDGRPLFFEQILCDEAGRAVIWEWWRAYGATLGFAEDRMLPPHQAVEEWRLGHTPVRLAFLFSSPDAEEWYLAHLTAWALEDTDG